MVLGWLYFKSQGRCLVKIQVPRSLPHPVNWISWWTELEGKEKVLECLLVCLFYNPSWTCSSRDLSSEIMHRCTWTWSIDTLAILFKIKRKTWNQPTFSSKRGMVAKWIMLYVYIYPLEYQGAVTREWVKWTSLKRLSETHFNWKRQVREETCYNLISLKTNKQTKIWHTGSSYSPL